MNKEEARLISRWYALLETLQSLQPLYRVATMKLLQQHIESELLIIQEKERQHAQHTSASNSIN